MKKVKINDLNHKINRKQHIMEHLVATYEWYDMEGCTRDEVNRYEAWFNETLKTPIGDYVSRRVDEVDVLDWA